MKWLKHIFLHLGIIGFVAMSASAIPLLTVAQADVGSVSAPSLVVFPTDTISILENEPTTLRLQVEHAGQEAVIFDVTPALENSNLDEQTGVYKFLPGFIQSGTYSLVFYATAETYFVTRPVRIAVQENNRTPQIKMGGGNVVMLNENEATKLQIVAVDPDVDNELIYSATPAIENMVVDEKTGEVYFAPDYFQAGTYDVVYSVSDSFDIASVTVSITVLNVNRSPDLQLNPPGDREVWYGETLNLLADGYDPDKETLSLSIVDQPPNSTFDTSTGAFQFIPALEQFRDRYYVTFKVTDGSYWDVEPLNLQVNAAFAQLFEFNQRQNPEGWFPNSWFNDFYVEDGFLKGVTQSGDPFFAHSGFRFDTFSKTKVVVNMKILVSTTIEMYFITTKGEFYGPSTMRVEGTDEFDNYVFDVNPFFPVPKTIESIQINLGNEANFFEIDYIGIYQSPFPDRTPTPIPTPSPTITPTPSPTFTPTPVFTPTMTPTPTKKLPKRVFDFDKHDTIADNFHVGFPRGFEQPVVGVEGVETTSLFSGNGLLVLAEPGQGTLLLTKERLSSQGEPITLRVSALTESKDAGVAVIALNSPEEGVIDGQMAYNNAVAGALTGGEEEALELFYDPPDEYFHLALQIVNPHSATQTAKVVMDELTVHTANPLIVDSTLELTPDGSFDLGVEDMISNMNAGDGSVQVVQG
ncbi:hypothetical protein GF373_16795, partial [bacterium]|nr:hypothetical protein [bacterium]